MKFIALVPVVACVIAGCGGSDKPYTVTDRVVESAISGSDPFDGGTHYEAFRVVALASGEGIVNMEGEECSICEEGSSVLNTQLYIKRLNGDAVAEDDDSGGGTDARVRFPVTAGDEFRVVATTADNKAGRYRLTVSENMRIAERLDH